MQHRGLVLIIAHRLKDAFIEDLIKVAEHQRGIKATHLTHKARHANISQGHLQAISIQRGKQVTIAGTHIGQSWLMLLKQLVDVLAELTLQLQNLSRIAAFFDGQIVGAVMGIHHVQHHIVIEGIVAMVVGMPIRGLLVYLHIAPQRKTIDHDACIEKVRTSTCVILSLIGDAQRLTAHRPQLDVQV